MLANIHQLGKKKRGRKESEKEKEIHYVVGKMFHEPEKIGIKTWRLFKFLFRRMILITSGY